MTTTAEDTGDLNKITVIFDAMLVPLPEIVVRDRGLKLAAMWLTEKRLLFFLVRKQVLHFGWYRIQRGSFRLDWSSRANGIVIRNGKEILRSGRCLI